MTTKEKESVSQLGRAAARDLRALLQSEVSLPGEPAYERARQIVNGAVNHSPALFVFCERSKDVQEAVRIARSYRLPLSVRGGGHDWAGRALRDQGLVIDLSRMRRVGIVNLGSQLTDSSHEEHPIPLPRTPFPAGNHRLRRMGLSSLLSELP